MSVKKASIFLVVICILLLASCGSGSDISASFPVTSEKTASPESTRPAETVVPSTEALESSGEDWTAEDDPYLWNDLPMSRPEISNEDLASFNPAKTVDYIVVNGVWHNYTLVKAELKDGKLYITINDDRCSYDVNDDYIYLRKKSGLSEEEMLKLPVFSESVMRDGMLYASEEAWQARLQYDSYDEWVGYDIAKNGMELGEITLAAIPVSENAKICLISMSDNADNLFIDTRQFSEYLLQGNTERDLAEEVQLFNMLFKYEDGQITGIYQDSGDM